jgi:hypothetical protein
MYYWGGGPTLGLLSIFGYVVFAAGAVYLWRYREDFFVWVLDEVSGLRRNLSRHTVVGPFYGLREESRVKTLPAGFLRSLNRMPRARFQRGTILIFLGALLLILDFFI